MRLSRNTKVVGVIGGIALALAAGILIRLLSESRAYLAEIPLPENAGSVSERYTVLGLRREVSFSIAEEYPEHSVRDFFQRWAESSGWHLVSAQEDPWSVDHWQSFVSVSAGEEMAVDQWLVRWMSPDSKWDLRVALRYERPRVSPTRPAVQTVYLAASQIGL